MNELALRKQALLAESEECRRQLARELEHLRATTEWVDKGISVARQARSWLSLLAPLAEIFNRRSEEPGERPEGWLRLGRRLITTWLRR